MCCMTPEKNTTRKELPWCGGCTLIFGHGIGGASSTLYYGQRAKYQYFYTAGKPATRKCEKYSNELPARLEARRHAQQIVGDRSILYSILYGVWQKRIRKLKEYYIQPYTCPHGLKRDDTQKRLFEIEAYCTRSGNSQPLAWAKMRKFLNLRDPRQAPSRTVLLTDNQTGSAITIDVRQIIFGLYYSTELYTMSVSDALFGILTPCSAV